MSETLKFGNGQWAVKEGLALAYNDENGNFKPLPFTFVRDTGATRVNKQGLIEVVPNNEPRIDFLNDSKGALKLEPLRSNLIQYSNFNSVWTNPSNFTLNTVVSPQGIQNGNTLSKGSAYDASSYIISSGVPSGQTAVFSVFVKKNTTNIVGIRLASGSSASDIRKNINLDTGEITNGVAGNQIGFISLEKEDFGNGWYRLKLKGTTSGADNVCSLYAGSIGTTTNDGEVYVYGSQLEQGYPTSYIPTQGSVGTRDAESCEQTPPDGIIGQNEGVLYAEIKANETSNAISRRTISLSNETNDNRIYISFDDEYNKLNIFIIVGTTLITIDNVDISDQNTFNKVAVRYKSGDSAIYVNGVLKNSFNTTFSGGVFNTLKFQNRGSGEVFYGNCKDLRVYNKALSDAELQELTKI